MPELFALKPAWDYQIETDQLISSPKNIVDEEEITLYINGDNYLNFISSPCDLTQLAVGFLFTENIVRDIEEIKDISVDIENHFVDIQLFSHFPKDRIHLRTSTGMTLCQGKTRQILPSFNSLIQGQAIGTLYNIFLDSRPTNNYSVSGLHSAALSNGKLINLLVEDIGRHNCIDKLAGFWLLSGKSFIPEILLLTGRISSEMIQKSFAMNIPIIVSRTTPTIKAIEIAEEVGVTIIGYNRHGNFSVFSHPEVIIL